MSDSAKPSKRIDRFETTRLSMSGIKLSEEGGELIGSVGAALSLWHLGEKEKEADYESRKARRNYCRRSWARL